MNINEYLMQMKKIHKELLQFIDCDNNCEEYYQNLISDFRNQKIQENPENLKSIFHMISRISNHHYRSQFFFSRIEKIILFFKNEIKISFSNFEIFNIFKFNKRILLFLIKEELLKFDQSIVRIILQKNYYYSYIFYFFNEIQPFLDEKLRDEIKKQIDKITNGDPSIFEQKRKEGENDSQLCQLIRRDSINEFISYVNQKNLPLSSFVERSNFETNITLIKGNDSDESDITLIEYASFFGSIQIFKYLFKNGIELKPSLFYYAIHGKDPELIKILEENDIKPSDVESYQKWMKESIKCHHNEIIDYIQTNYSKVYDENDYDFFVESLHYYNFMSLSNVERDFLPFFVCFCEYDYISIVKFLLNNSQLNINMKMQNGVSKLNYLNKAGLHAAAEKGNTEIVELLLSNPNININILSILTLIFFFIKIKIAVFFFYFCSL